MRRRRSAVDNFAHRTGQGSLRRSPVCSRTVTACFAFAIVVSTTTISLADEDGVSFWLPGLFGSLAAAPQKPGWSFAAINYYDSISASGTIAAAREIRIGKLNPTVNVDFNVNIHANLDFVLLNTGYVFATPVFGGQLAVGMTGIVGTNDTNLNGTITAGVGGFSVTKQGSISDTTTGFGDLYPIASLRWNSGVNNYMVYATGDIPIGSNSRSDQVSGDPVSDRSLDLFFRWDPHRCSWV
jgi:hypothetical protein